jgi:hypothetical protein
LLLPEDFWSANSRLTHIRRYARSRHAGADVVLYSALARVAAMLPPGCRLETGIGSERGTSLNFFVGIIAPSGHGKSTGIAVAKDQIHPPPQLATLDIFRDDLPLGSGEGVAEAFYAMVPTSKEEREATGKKLKRELVRSNAFFHADEGETLARLNKRDSSTLGPTLRTAWYGGTIGNANAAADRLRIVPEGRYSLGMVIGFQPESALALLEEVALGTAQRFIYGWALDEYRPRHPDLVEANPITLDPPQHRMTLDHDIAAEIADHHHAVTTGALKLDPYDSHDYFTITKMAALLAILDGGRRLSREKTGASPRSCGRHRAQYAVG